MGYAASLANVVDSELHHRQSNLGYIAQSELAKRSMWTRAEQEQSKVAMEAVFSLNAPLLFFVSNPLLIFFAQFFFVGAEAIAIGLDHEQLPFAIRH